MSSDEDEFEYNEQGELVRRKRKIKVNVDLDNIAEKVAEKLSEEEIQVKALEAFERQKKVYAEKYHSDDFLTCATPKEVDELSRQIEYEKSIPQKRNPSGKASLRKNMDSAEFESPTELLDNLYEVGYPRGMQPKTEEAVKAREKIKKLFDSMLSGKGWSEMQDLIRNNKGEQVEKLLGATTFFSCPKCNHTISRFPCGFCGYNPKTERREGKVF